MESINYEDGSVITPEMARKEQLLYASTDKYGIYQLKPNLELDSLRFEGTESLKRMGITKIILMQLNQRIIHFYMWANYLNCKKRRRGQL